MSQCVPSWDLNEVNLNYDLPNLDYEVTELKWENGHPAMQGLGPRRVPDKPQYTWDNPSAAETTTPSLPKYTWDKPRAAETLEAIVNQATLLPYLKPQAAVNGDELVPWLHHHHHHDTATVNASATMTTDALVPSSIKRTYERSGHTLRSTKSVRDAGCSTRVGSCSGDPAAFVNRRLDGHGGDWSVSGNETVGTLDTCETDLSSRRFTSTSSGSPENTSSGKDCTKSTSPDDSACNRKPQRETNGVNEKKRGRKRPSISSKRSRTAAIHNQSECKRRDKINIRMKTLQDMVPNSSKTDKASMLDGVIEHLKQLQAQVNIMNRMNMPSMMMPLSMQQQMHMSMMNSMGMGMGMGMGVVNINTIGRSNIPVGFQPSSFMHMPSWDGHAIERVPNATALAMDPMSAFLACRSQPMNMDAYRRMVALFQHMQNQQHGPFSNN